MRFFQAPWFQVASLAAVTTGRTGVKILVSFWPEHSLRSDLRALNLKFFPGGACLCNALALAHALINRRQYQTKIAASGPVDC